MQEPGRILPASTGELLLGIVAVGLGVAVILVAVPIAEESTADAPIAALDLRTVDETLVIEHRTGQTIDARLLTVRFVTQDGHAASVDLAQAGGERGRFVAGEVRTMPIPIDGDRLTVTVRYEPTGAAIAAEELRRSDPAG